MQAGHTLAYLTAHHGHADVLKVLYEYGADLAATRVRGLLHAFNLDVSNRHQMTLRYAIWIIHNMRHAMM